MRHFSYLLVKAVRGATAKELCGDTVPCPLPVPPDSEKFRSTFQATKMTFS